MDKYITYKAREFYPATNKPYWVLRIVGPLNDLERQIALEELREAPKSSVKDIVCLREDFDQS